MSDSESVNSGLVVGTAGHIDHGKTSLVRALTGVDTDRLPEEKRRGISIDLGFAELNLGEGQSVSFVDVPGHERFVRNMLAGAAGMRAVLLIVAATEGVMPQTREHFEICRLLGIRYGLVVLTKVDLATAEQLRRACDQVRELCADSFLENAPLVQTSTQTGVGLDDLVGELRKLAHTKAEIEGGVVPRLWIDRKFSKTGFGTVVTGTLASGTLSITDDIVIFPSKRELRIRSMQIHGRRVETAYAGQRTAVNLSGVVPAELERGHVLTVPSEIKDSFVVDAWIEWLSDAERPEGRTSFSFHVGSAECVASVKVLAALNGQRTLVRMWTSRPMLVLPRDRFILRRMSPPHTVAGGEILEVAPPLRLSRVRAVRRLESLIGADDASRMATMVMEAPTGRTLNELQRSTGLTFERIRGLVRGNPDLLLCEAQRVVVTKAWLGERRNRLTKWLTEFHQHNPSLPGAPLAQARLGLRAELAEIVLDKNPNVRVAGDLVSLPTHKPLFSEQETADLARVESAFRQGAFQPPAINEVLSAVSRDGQRGKRLLDMLLKSRRLVRVSDELVFHADVIAHVRTSLAAHRGKRFNVSEFKDWTQMSRKYAIPMLEFLDRERVTRRDGDQRVIL